MTVLTNEGLVAPRFQEVLENLVNKEKTNISPLIDAADNKFLGQFNKSISEVVTSIYSLAEIVYSANDISAAYGIQLDWIGAFKNIPRLPSSQSQGSQIFIGEIGTNIPAGATVEDTNSKNRYYTTTAYTVTNLSLVQAKIIIDSVQNSTDYIISIAGVAYTYTSDSSATSTEIYNGLKAQIDADVDVDYTVTVTSQGLDIIVDGYSPKYFALSENLTFLSGGVLGYVYGEVDGPDVQAISSVTRIVTPVLGLTETYNPYSFVVGSYIEDDEDYRARLNNPAIINGYATLPAIESVVGSVAGVSYVKVEENDDVVDGDIPAKSIQVVVEGGTDAEVAQAIFTSKGASVKTYGDVAEVVIHEGQPHQINFSRPSGVYFAVRIIYERYLEETLPEDALLSIKDAIVTSINAQGIGVDLIPQRLFEALYSAATGIGGATIETQVIALPGDTPTGVWTTDTTPISANQFSQISVNDVILQEA